MRGLKLKARKRERDHLTVASFTDAWIETKRNMVTKKQILVASFTDAWIETSGGYENVAIPESHLLQMRGLKQQLQLGGGNEYLVASFTDAWIET